MADLVQRRIGKLDAHVITAAPTPEALAIFCHGYGAPADDLVAIGAQLMQRHPELLDKVEMIFPGAPLSLAELGLSTGRAWWSLDLERLMQPDNSRDIEAMRHHCPDELPQAREMLTQLIEESLSLHQLPLNRLVLGGFSQGSMLATDVTLHLPEPVGGLAIWSGALINEAEWASKIEKISGIPVVQSHGRADPILPIQTGIWLRDLLKSGGAELNFLQFDGPHTIPMAAISAVGDVLSKLIDEGSSLS